MVKAKEKEVSGVGGGLELSKQRLLGWISTF